MGNSEIVTPFGFLPAVTPGRIGPFFELRYYTLKAGKLPDVAKGWEEKIPERRGIRDDVTGAVLQGLVRAVALTLASVIVRQIAASRR